MKSVKILAFLCKWCSYAGADYAGVARIHYPATVRIIRVPCSGRVSPELVLKAFQSNNIDGVLVAGCHFGDCHYQTGNYRCQRHMTLLKELLGFVGIEPARLHVEWISATEGHKFAQAIREFTEILQKLGSN